MDKVETVNHINGVRMRINGSGHLNMSLSDLDDTNTKVLVPLTMAATTALEPTRLSNFQSQRIRLIGTTTVINEYFVIKRIIIFIKPVAVELPG